VAATLVVTAASALRAGRVFTRGFDPDEFQHLHGGWCLAHGLWPYRDYFEHHTPWLWLALAPFFALFDVDRDPERAVAFVLAARGAMWILGSAALVLTFLLGRMWAGPATGWLAAAMLSVTLAFVEKSIEIRPDVPALVCLLGSWMATASALRRAPEERGTRGRLAAAGFLLGAAVLFTQKVALTLPATLVVLLAWVLDRRQWRSRRARVLGLAAFGVGAAVPLVATLALFAAHTGISRFIELNVTRNADWRVRFSPVPFLRAISQANLADVLGISAPMLSQVMSGRRAKIGNPAVLARLIMLERKVLTPEVAAGKKEALLRALDEVRESKPSVTRDSLPVDARQNDRVAVAALRRVIDPGELAAAAEALNGKFPDLAELLRRAARPH